MASYRRREKEWTATTANTEQYLEIKETLERELKAARSVIGDQIFVKMFRKISCVFFSRNFILHLIVFKTLFLFVHIPKPRKAKVRGPLYDRVRIFFS